MSHSPAAAPPALPEAAVGLAHPLEAERPAWSAISGLLLALVAGLYIYLVFRTAWLTDDAHITFRTIDNFIHGYGLTWNVTERVQAYTHPLWMFLLSGLAFITREIPHTSIYTSILLSAAVVTIYAFGIARTAAQAIVGLVLLSFSKAYVDYSTGGLENPLSHLLLALFFLVWWREDHATGRRLLLLSFLACLGVLNRMDSLLVFAPALAYAFWQQRSARALGRVMLGFVPLAAWEAFSLLYYGSLVPNTAYAKLNTGAPALAFVAHGLFYLRNSLWMDPLTLPTIAAGLAVAAWLCSSRAIAWAIGIALYLLYTVKIGGDFMSGRFLTMPFLMAVLLVGAAPLRLSRAKWISAGLLAACLGLLSPYPSLLTDGSYGLARADLIDNQRVSDERAYYYPVTGLLRSNPGIWTDAQGFVDNGRALRDMPVRVVAQGAIGMLGLIAGPEKHIVDIYALADPLLARLPVKADLKLAIGHYTRHVPEGYIETLTSWIHAGGQIGSANRASTWSGTNQFADPALAEFYEKLCLITRGPLFDRQRLAAIVRMNLGAYDHLIDTDFYRYPPERVYWLTLTNRLRDRRLDFAYETIPLPRNGLIVTFDGPLHAPQLDVALDVPGEYRFVWPRPDAPPLEQATELPPPPEPGLTHYEVDVPPEVVRDGYDRVRIYKAVPDADVRLGRVMPLVNGQPILQPGSPAP